MKYIFISLLILLPALAEARSSTRRRYYEENRRRKEQQRAQEKEQEEERQLAQKEAHQKLMKQRLSNSACLKSLPVLKEHEDIGAISGTKKEIYNLSLIKKATPITKEYVTLSKKGVKSAEVGGIYEEKYFYTLTKKYYLLNLTFIDDSEVEVVLNNQELLKLSESCMPQAQVPAVPETVPPVPVLDPVLEKVES